MSVKSLKVTLLARGRALSEPKGLGSASIPQPQITSAVAHTYICILGHLGFKIQNVFIAMISYSS